MNTDSISYYSEAEIKAWYQEFNREENLERVTLPGIPFSFYEIRRELLRLDFVRGVLEDLGK